MNIPTWALSEITSYGFVAQKQPQNVEIQEIQEFLERDFRAITSTQIIPCETSSATVRNIHRVKTGEHCIIWDERYFQAIEKCLICSLASPSEYKLQNLQAYLAIAISRSCAERLLYRSPKDAHAVINFFEKLEEENYISKIQIDDVSKCLSAMKYIRWWTFFHELGHELFHTVPELVSNIEEKVSIAVKLSETLPESNEKTGSVLIDEARSHLKEINVIQSHKTRHKEILKSLSNSLEREEIWCDVFAVEQLVLYGFLRKCDPAHMYFALMINHYINTLITSTTSYFNSHITDEKYILGLNFNKALAMRADLRALHLNVMLFEIYIKPLNLDIEEFQIRWIGAHYPALSQFSEINRGILKTINNFDLRKNIFNEHDIRNDNLSQEQKIKTEKNIISYLKWDVPIL